MHGWIMAGFLSCAMSALTMSEATSNQLHFHANENVCWP